MLLLKSGQALLHWAAMTTNPCQDATERGANLTWAPVGMQIGIRAVSWAQTGR
jgi:hypothetical protein